MYLVKKQNQPSMTTILAIFSQYFRRLASEKECAELRNKLDRLNDQIGEYEGEISTLRGRIGGLEDEVSKLRATNKRLQDDIARLRAVSTIYNYSPVLYFNYVHTNVQLLESGLHVCV